VDTRAATNFLQSLIFVPAVCLNWIEGPPFADHVIEEADISGVSFVFESLLFPFQPILFYISINHGKFNERDMGRVPVDSNFRRGFHPGGLEVVGVGTGDGYKVIRQQS
jgi:hypothetical protein